MGRKTRYSDEQWEKFRFLITRLYSEERKTLKEVRSRLQNEYHFAPTENMYKLKLRLWGLEKRHKKHEMIAIVRESLTKGQHQNFKIRGNVVTLRDALHYFRRKGISKPEEVFELAAAAPVIGRPVNCVPAYQLNNFTSIYTVPPTLRQRVISTTENQIIQALIYQSQSHYQQILSIRDISLYNPSKPVSTIEAGAGAELVHEFSSLFHQGCFFLGNSQPKHAYRRFFRAFGMLQRLIDENCKEFLICVLDLIVRLDGGSCKAPITSLMERLAQLTASETARECNLAVYLIASWLEEPSSGVSRPFVAFVTLHNLVSFFADRIGNFHPWTLEIRKLDEKLSIESSTQEQYRINFG